MDGIGIVTNLIYQSQFSVSVNCSGFQKFNPIFPEVIHGIFIFFLLNSRGDIPGIGKEG